MNIKEQIKDEMEVPINQKLRRKVDPMAMSFTLKDNPNEIPSMHMHLRQASKVVKYVKKMHE
jgi:hypothetical protein